MSDTVMIILSILCLIGMGVVFGLMVIKKLKE